MAVEIPTESDALGHCVIRLSMNHTQIDEMQPFRLDGSTVFPGGLEPRDSWVSSCFLFSCW